MTTRSVPLRHTPGFATAWLRPPRGRDELLVEDASTGTALALLGRLLVPSPAGAPAPRAASLAAADRDRVLAGVFASLYGARIESTVQCGACGEPFDLDFSLDALVAERSFGEAEAPPDGLRRWPDLPPFRLPDGDDELAAAGLPPADGARLLLQRCVGNADASIDPDALELVMSRIAPLLSVDLTAACPACPATLTLRFDVQSFLLHALLGERDRLLREVHTLALTYGWTRREILSLARGERRRLVSLIEGDAGARWT